MDAELGRVIKDIHTPEKIRSAFSGERGSHTPIRDVSIVGQEIKSQKNETGFDEYTEAGLKKETIFGFDVYSLDIHSEGAREKLASLREIVNPKRVAVEVGPGNQLDSMFFAATHAQADVVVGIDPFFDNLQMLEPTQKKKDENPTIVLLKGDAWGNQYIKDFFGSHEDDPSKRLAVYSQIVAPDTQMAESLIRTTRSFSREGHMIILDSGAVEHMSNTRYPEHAIQKRLLTDKGVSNPTHLDWVKHTHRSSQLTEIDAEEYRKGMGDGTFPQTHNLRSGRMLIFQRPVATKITQKIL